MSKPINSLFYSGALFFITLLQPGYSIAQSCKIVISSDKVEKSTKDFTRYNYAILKTILPAANNSGFISLIKSWRDGSEFDRAGVVFQDSALHVLKEKDLLKDIKSTNVFDLVRLGGRVYFFYTTLKKDKYSLYSSEIDVTTLEKIGEPVLQAEFEKISIYDWNSFETVYSADSTKVLLYSPHPVHNVSKKTVDFIVFDSKMNKLYSNKYSFDKPTEAIKIKDYFLGNDGSFYISYFMGIKGYINKSYIKNDGGKVAPYELHFVKINEMGGEDVQLPSNEMFLETVHSFQDNKGQINIAGIYKKDYDELPSGAYRIKFSNGEKNIKFNSYESLLL